MKMGGFMRSGRALRRLFVIGLLLLVCVACGRKAPPVPPSFDGLTPPSGVAASAEGETLTIKWADPPSSEERMVTGYRIYLSTLKEGEERCEGCPVRFVRAGDAGAADRQFSISVSAGALYTIEVRATAEGGYVTDPSKRVDVDLRGRSESTE
jgi:hypothetical protein